MKKRKDTKNIAYLSFDEARAFARLLGLKGYAEWQAYCKSGKKPPNIPSSPYYVYKNQGWTSYPDFLGKQFPSRSYKNYDEAILFVHDLKLKNSVEWIKYCKGGQRPNDIPPNPKKFYGKLVWVSWKAWLGPSYISPEDISKKRFRSFEEAKAFVHTLNLKNENEWNAFCKSGQKPNDIPSSPRFVYRPNWVSINDWLGTKRRNSKACDFWPFEDARNYVRSLGLKTKAEWCRYYKSDKRPLYIPTDPFKIYKSRGWISMGDWLGTKTVSNRLRHFKSYEEAKAFIKLLNLKSSYEWDRYVKSGQKPNDIPNKPSITYKDKGWINWDDWLDRN